MKNKIFNKKIIQTIILELVFDIEPVKMTGMAKEIFNAAKAILPAMYNRLIWVEEINIKDNIFWKLTLEEKGRKAYLIYRDYYHEFIKESSEIKLRKKIFFEVEGFDGLKCLVSAANSNKTELAKNICFTKKKVFLDCGPGHGKVYDRKTLEEII